MDHGESPTAAAASAAESDAAAAAVFHAHRPGGGGAPNGFAYFHGRGDGLWRWCAVSAADAAASAADVVWVRHGAAFPSFAAANG